MKLHSTLQAMPACSGTVASSQPSPEFICWAWHHTVWNIHLASLDQLSWCILSRIHVPIPPSSLQAMRSWKFFNSVQTLLSNNKKHHCVTSTILLLKLKHKKLIISIHCISLIVSLSMVVHLSGWVITSFLM